jgi:hypothetical protein
VQKFKKSSGAKGLMELVLLHQAASVPEEHCASIFMTEMMGHCLPASVTFCRITPYDTDDFGGLRTLLIGCKFRFYRCLR